jgi:hypothetical protein
MMRFIRQLRIMRSILKHDDLPWLDAWELAGMAMDPELLTSIELLELGFRWAPNWTKRIAKIGLLVGPRNS